MSGPPQLDISALANAVVRLREGLDRHLKEPDDEQGLLRGDWPLWRQFRDMRASTSHTYSAIVAAQVAAGIPGFLTEATYLVEQLRQRLR
jgi:hypothetical protein